MLLNVVKSFSFPILFAKKYNVKYGCKRYYNIRPDTTGRAGFLQFIYDCTTISNSLDNFNSLGNLNSPSINNPSKFNSLGKFSIPGTTFYFHLLLLLFTLILSINNITFSLLQLLYNIRNNLESLIFFNFKPLNKCDDRLYDFYRVYSIAYYFRVGRSQIK